MLIKASLIRYWLSAILCLPAPLLAAPALQDPEQHTPIEIAQLFYGPHPTQTPVPTVDQTLRTEECRAYYTRYMIAGPLITCIVTAAEQGQRDAQALLAGMYYFGMGVTMDKTKAFIWNSKAAAQGQAIAEFHLGIQYMRGMGVKRDERQAFI